MNDIPLTLQGFCAILYVSFSIPMRLQAGGYNMRCQLSTLMGQSRYSIQDVHNKTGLARSTVTQLYHDKATRIDFETIEKLCALFQCNINDLLELEGTKSKG